MKCLIIGKKSMNMRNKEFNKTAKAALWLGIGMALAPFLCDAAFVDQTSTLAPGLGGGHAAWGDFNNDTYPDPECRWQAMAQQQRHELHRIVVVRLGNLGRL
jgi:hypothetical protein